MTEINGKNLGRRPVRRLIGRPPKFPGERLEQRSIRMTPSQWAKFDAIGIDGLRKIIDGLCVP